MLTALTTILGAVSTSIPSLLKHFDRKQELKHERELLKLQMDAAAKKVNLEIALAESKAGIEEGDSLRSHDSTLSGNIFIESLRASVRPVITYLFFLMFVIIKGSAAYVMLQNGNDIPTMLQAIWDTETMAIFGSIMGFWFGSRAIEKFRKS